MWAWVSLALAGGGAPGPGQCGFFLDGVPVDLLDCTAGGAWTVRCPLPDGPADKIRLHATLTAHGLVAEARVRAEGQPEIVVSLGGPGGRSGGFVVTRAAAGLLPGQALGPNQWCPVVQPGVAPGSPRAEVELEIGAAVHRQTGFAEEPLDGGVTNRVPIYDAGQTYASAEVTVLQREVGTVPVMTGPVPTGPRDEAVRGQLSIAGPDGIWRSFGWTGGVVERPLETGDVTVLVLDFVHPEVATAAGSDPIAWLQADLTRWLARDPTSLLGHAAWAKSGFEPSGGGQALTFAAKVERAKRKWTLAADERLEVRLLREDDRLRVVIAWRAAPWDDAVRAEVEAAAAYGL